MKKVWVIAGAVQVVGIFLYLAFLKPAAPVVKII
jgi:hypothetical protein